MIEIPISMVLLSQVLKYNLNRWANIIIGAIGIVFVIITDTKDMNDIFFPTIEVLSLSMIVWCAWKWHKPRASID